MKRVFVLFLAFMIVYIYGCSGGSDTTGDTSISDTSTQTDCNDDRVGKPCEAGVGECKREGKYICDKNTLEVKCDAVAGKPTKEVCDGKDNNCDGKTDEDWSEIGQVCKIGKGQCESTGVYTCNEKGDGIVCNAPEILPSTEICDGLDNDCNGDTDEVFTDLGKDCEEGKGECKVTGKFICSPDKSGVVCDAIPGEPQKELCDGKDNNCDGFTDEDFPELGKSCEVGLGECKSMGKYVCSPDGSGVVCDAVPGKPQVELCDKKDNNCDGFTDEEAPDCSVILAGNMKTPYKTGKGLTETYFVMPYGIVFDSEKNEIVVGDYVANFFFKLEYDDVTRSYNSSVFSGDGFRGDRTGNSDVSEYSGPAAIALDSKNKKVIFTDTLNNKIKSIDLDTFTSNTLAGNGKIGYDNGDAENTTFYYPMGVAIDADGVIYVSDTYNHCIRRLTYDTFKQKYVADTYAGSCGTSGNTNAPNPLDARFNMPSGLAIADNGDIYVADRGNSRVRLISKVNGVSTYISISGADITSLAIDEYGYLFVVDYNGTLRQVSPTLNLTTLLSGLKGPVSIALGKNSSSYITESKSGMIRKVNLSNGSFTFVAGKGRSLEPQSDYSTPLAYPMGLLFDEDKKDIFISNTYSNRVIQISNYKVKNIAGDGTAGSLDTNLYLPAKMAMFKGDIYLSDKFNHCIKKLSFDSNVGEYVISVVAGKCGTSGNANGDASSSRLNKPDGISMLDENRLVFVDSGNHCVRVIENGVVSTYSGKCGTKGKVDGAGNVATFNSPEGIVCNSKKLECYVADTGNNIIRKINPDGSVERYSGDPNNDKGSFKDGGKDEAQFNQPAGISMLVNFDESVTLYVADRYNHAIRTVDVLGNVQTIIGTTECSNEYGERATTGLCMPSDIYVKSDGSMILVDSGNNRVLGIY